MTRARPRPLVTVFVSTYQRLDTLRRTVASYRKLRTPHELVIVDNGSTHPDSLKLLDVLGPRVKKVYRLPGCQSYDEVADNLNIAIRDQYETGDSADWYAVTDADICFDGTNPHALELYVYLAETFRTAVGPHLRVHDIPHGYPLRSRVLACESRLLYRDQMQWIDSIPYTRTQTDTTFHLFSARRRFDRLHMDPIRVGPPYDAQHLDWYLDVFQPTRENSIYITDERKLGSWGKAWLRDYWLWYQRHGAAEAFRRLMGEPQDTNDLCNVSFVRAWCYQYGVGTPVDIGESQFWLDEAIPHPHEHYTPYKQRWARMIYNDEFSSLGWDNLERAA